MEEVLLIVRHWRKIASARLKVSHRNYGHVRIGRLLWQVNLEPTICLAKFQGLRSCGHAICARVQFPSRLPSSDWLVTAGAFGTNPEELLPDCP